MSMMEGDEPAIARETRIPPRRRDALSQSLQSSVIDIDQPLKYRSVYLPVVRDSLPRALELFDFAEPSMVMGVRETSNTPAQGLFLMNNEFVIEQSKFIAKRVMAAETETEQQIELAFRLAYGRDATETERQLANEFIERFNVFTTDRKLSRAEETKFKKLAALCQAIVASAEFRYVN
jgi:hypothetical protein